MSLLLRSCILSRMKPFISEVTLSKSVFRCYTKHNIKKFTPFLQARHFSTIDDTKKKSYEVYIGPINKTVFSLKVLSLLTSIVSITTQPILFLKMSTEDNIANIAVMFLFLNFLTIVNPVVIHQLSKRYVLSITHCPVEDKYTATQYTFLCGLRQTTFTPDDVIVPGSERTAMLTTCFVKKMPLLLDEKSFTIPKHYNIIMGFNKPIDFEVEKLNVASINSPPTIEKSHQIESKNEKKE